LKKKRHFKRYLLVISILGFSSLVEESRKKVRSLFKVIDSLEVHNHRFFNTVVNADKIIIYNNDEPMNESDHRYFVMYACEFVQRLIYKTLKFNVYYRAILTYGEFEHYTMQNIEPMWGRAYNFAIQKLQEIECLGLFIDRRIKKHNYVFVTRPYDPEIDFLYLNQSLDRLEYDFEHGDVNIQYKYNETDRYHSLEDDIRYLKQIHHLMLDSYDPLVRSVFLATWQFFKLQYKRVLAVVEYQDFDLERLVDFEGTMDTILFNVLFHREISEIEEEEFERGMKDGTFGLFDPPLDDDSSDDSSSD
jgi:hypothetical protein